MIENIPKSSLWHFRLGYFSHEILEIITRKNPIIFINKDVIYDICHLTKQDIACFECKKPRHMRLECPKLISKKSVMTTWQDSDYRSNFSSNKNANICLVTDINKEVYLNLISDFLSTFEYDDVDENDLPYEDLFNNYNLISNHYLKLKQNLKFCLYKMKCSQRKRCNL